MLDVRRLRVLHAVSEYGSVTAAAAALGYTAPAVSQQLAALERETGMRLTGTRRAGHRADPGRRHPGRAHRRPVGPAGRGRVRHGRAPRPGGGPGRAGGLPVRGRRPRPGGLGGAGPPAPHVQLDLTEMEPEESLPARAARRHRHRHRSRVRPAAPPARPAVRTPRSAPRPSPASPSPADPRWTSQDAATSRTAWPAGRSWPRATHTSCAEMIQRACARAGFVPRSGGPGHRFRRLAQPGRGGRWRHPGPGAGHPAPAARGPAAASGRTGDPEDLHRQPPRRRPQARGPRRPRRPGRRA